MCVTSLLCGPRADLWPFYGFLCKRFSVRYKGLPRWAPTDCCIATKEIGDVCTQAIRCKESKEIKTKDLELGSNNEPQP